MSRRVTDPAMLTVPQAAELLSYSPRSLQRLLRDNGGDHITVRVGGRAVQIGVVRVGGAVRIPRAAVERACGIRQ